MLYAYKLSITHPLVYNKTQRDILWDLEAAFLERPVFNVLMDEIIQRKLLDGNSAQTPKKEVRIMMCADFEDSHLSEEKFFHFTPKHMTLLPKFRLCNAKYWEPDMMKKKPFEQPAKSDTGSDLQRCEYQLSKLGN